MISFRDKDPRVRVAFTWIAAGSSRDFRIHGIPSFSILPLVPFQGFNRWFPFSMPVPRLARPKTFFQPSPPPTIDASRASPSRWLTNQIPPLLISLSSSLLLPPSRYPVSRRLPADWTRLGRPDNPIEFEFMDIRKRAARVAGLKGRRESRD